VEGGLAALNKWVPPQADFIINDTFSLADIAAGSVLGYMKVRFPNQDWQQEYPNLKRYSDGLEARESFRETVPKAQVIGDKIV
jgi:glutathione S-transferase